MLTTTFTSPTTKLVECTIVSNCWCCSLSVLDRITTGTHGMHVENVQPKIDFSFCSYNSFQKKKKKIIAFNRIYFLHQNNHIQH